MALFNQKILGTDLPSLAPPPPPTRTNSANIDQKNIKIKKKEGTNARSGFFPYGTASVYPIRHGMAK
jgi:hypothetical protein